MAQNLKRKSAFKDVPVSVARDAVDKLPITQGVEETLEALRFLGIKTAVVGCPSVAIRGIKARLGIDYVMGPELEVDGNVYTGKLVGSWSEETQFNPKRDSLRLDASMDSIRLIAERELIPAESVVIVTSPSLVADLRGKVSAPRRFIEFSAAAQRDLRRVLLLLGLNFDAVHSLLDEHLPPSPVEVPFSSSRRT